MGNRSEREIKTQRNCTPTEIEKVQKIIENLNLQE